MSNKERLLREEVDRLRQRLSRLEIALEVLDEFEDTSLEVETADTVAGRDPLPPKATTSSAEQAVDTRPYPTAVVRGLFEAEPERRWRPMEIAARLQEMQDRNELRSKKGRDLVDATHTILRDLTKQGFINKSQPHPGSHQSFYVKTPGPP